MELPRTNYAKNGDVHLAYHVWGAGPVDLVVVPGWVSHLELDWEAPTYSYQMRRLAQFARVIRFDKRGTGLSDRDVGMPSLEERMDDMRAVMDDVGIERAVVWGGSEGGPMAILFAATYPERTAALILEGAFACPLRDDEQPWAVTADDLDQFVRYIEKHWGTGELRARFAPDSVDTVEKIDWAARYERNAASPRGAAMMMRINGQIDVRPVLASLQVPTLVIHHDGDPIVSVEHGRALARRIAGARYLELTTDNHPIVNTTLADETIDAIEEFLTGAKHGPDLDRVLATVLFTDIVASTELAQRQGDRQWRAALDAHDDAVRHELDRYRGREVKTLGDGFLATFDGPARAVRCAVAIQNSARRIGIDVRCGVHTGEVELRAEGDIGGIAVHLAKRVSDQAGGGEVIVSRTVVDLVAGSGLDFADRGEHALKGLTGPVHLFAVA